MNSKASTRRALTALEACLFVTLLLLASDHAGAQQDFANRRLPSPTGTVTRVGQSPEGPTRSTVPGSQQLPGAARVSPAPADLNLGAAINLALENNLATLLARERRREAHGVEQQARAGLLPNISATANQANLTTNLAALGFTGERFPGFGSTFIGPFNNFDARARLQQAIFNLS